MAFNRIVDRRIDALNPRTSKREIPPASSEFMKHASPSLLRRRSFGRGVAAQSPLPFVGALRARLGARVQLHQTLYALGPRRPRHGLGIAPVGGYLAVTGAWSDPWWMLPVLAASVMTWVAGFDVLYALQDVAFDRQTGLHSIPAAVGEARALIVARVFHSLTVIARAP